MKVYVNKFCGDVSFIEDIRALELPEEADSRELLEICYEKSDKQVSHREFIHETMVMINSVISALGTPLHDGDRVNLFRTIEGG